MRILNLVYVLFKIRLLTPFGLCRLLNSIFQNGISIMTLLSLVEGKYRDKTVLVDDNETLSYRELLYESKKLAACLEKKYKLKKGQKVGFLCRNHASLIKAIFASAALGMDIFLLNAEMSSRQFDILLAHHNYDFLVYDSELEVTINQSNYTKGRILSYHNYSPAINNLIDIEKSDEFKPRRIFNSKIVLLTSGTTGSFKEALHKPSLFNYINPFVFLITKLNLTSYDNAYIATPIYHGYGIAIFLSFMALGKKVIISARFNAENACSLIKTHKVDVVTVVPLMIKRMLENNTESLRTLACIASGGARLNPKLVDKVRCELGDILYNLYGTSEAGLNMIATPQDLKYSVDTIGRKIHGARIKILSHNLKEVEVGEIGEFCVKNKWSMKNSADSWIKTGDTGYRDSNGYYYLSGRTDDMIVSGGENVYAADVERVIIKHPKVMDAAVIGVTDDDFGYRLKAFIVPAAHTDISQSEILQWLSKRVARYEMPKDFVFVDTIPHTPLGKIDRKKLNLMSACANCTQKRPSREG